MTKHGGTRALLALFSTMVLFPAAGTGQVVSGATGDRRATRPSQSLKVVAPEGQVTLSLGELRALPQTSVTVHNAHTNSDERYTGVKLMEVLAKAGVKPGKGTLHSYVTGTGSDGYWVLYSGEEISDVVHAGTVLVAIAVDGHPLGGDGQFKLVSTEDRKPERWVRNLEGVRWVQAVP